MKKKIKRSAQIEVLFLILILLLILFCCGRKQDNIEKIMEDGVEVVINHLEPYKIRGEPAQLILTKELTIDLERPEFIELGFRLPEFVEADSEGNIYIVDNSRVSDYFICKFDREGNFIKNLCRKGQGPGEIQQIYYLQINDQDKILISDARNMKIVEFDKEGNLIKETRIKHGLRNVIPLDNGNYLATGSFRDPSSEGVGMNLILFDSDFKEIKKLDFFDTSDFKPGKKTTGTILSFYWRVADGKIYVGNEQRGYEIWEYDLNGHLQRKIRKKYIPAEYPEEFKEQTKILAERNPDLNLYAAEYTPPFNSFFIDDDGRLFVMTYEHGDDKQEFIHDIFSSDGVFVTRKSIGISSILGRALNHLRATAKNNRYYRIRYKANGFVELVVYKMVWE